MTLILSASLILGLILGVFAHRAGLCTVKAVAEVLTTRRGWFLWSFAKASLWTMALLSIAGAVGFAPVLRQWPLTGVSVIGGVLFGLGAGTNGACSFSTLARLAEGHLVMGFTLLGWPIGMLALHLALPDLHHAPLAASRLSGWLLLPLAPWMIWELKHIIDRFADEGLAVLWGAHWPLSISVAVVALANVGLLMLTGAWSYTSMLICTTDAAPLASCGHPLPLFAVSAAAMAGMIGSALLRGSFRIRPIRLAAALRHGLGGVAMGAGAALVPGGNDGLILFGLPALSPHALPAWLGICAGVACALIVMRVFGRPLMAIRCDADICRAVL